MKSLLSKGLAQEIGRSDGPGRPILYGTTTEFLQHFGLASLAELPPFDQAGGKPEPLPVGNDQPELSKHDNNILKD
jgi:segregation and condensation protein B